MNLTTLAEIAEAFGFSTSKLKAKMKDKRWPGNALIETVKTTDDDRWGTVRKYRRASREAIAKFKKLRS